MGYADQVAQGQQAMQQGGGMPPEQGQQDQGQDMQKYVQLFQQFIQQASSLDGLPPEQILQIVAQIIQGAMQGAQQQQGAPQQQPQQGMM